MTWKEYENRVSEYFQERYPSALIKKNVKLQGRLSKTPREIDILIEAQIFGHSLQIAIECKNWTTKLDVADVGTFIDKLKDVGISKGVMVSRKGYSSSAHQRARTELELQLQVLEFENLPEFYGFWGNPYRGHIGAVISAPNGWVVNSKVPQNMLPDMLCLIHPLEYNPSEASKLKQFMYFQVYPILEDGGVEKTKKHQDEVVLSKDQNAKIIYWTENIEKGQVSYRQIDYSIDNYTEFTAFVEADDFFAYCVCQAPPDHLPDDLARLRYVVSELHLIKISGIDPTNSHQYWQQLMGKTKKKDT